MLKNFNPFALLGVLGFFGLLGFLTGQTTWFWWFAWLIWFGQYNKPTDERFFANLAKAALPCFAITMLGLMILLFLKGLGAANDLIFSGLELVFVIPFVGFMILHRYFEVYGD